MHMNIMQKALHENPQYLSYDCLCSILENELRGTAGSGKILSLFNLGSSKHVLSSAFYCPTSMLQDGLFLPAEIAGHLLSHVIFLALVGFWNKLPTNTKVPLYIESAKC